MWRTPSAIPPPTSRKSKRANAPRLSILTAIAAELGVSMDVLLAQEPPSERAGLELELAKLQDAPSARKAQLPRVSHPERIGTEELRALVGLHHALAAATTIRSSTPEEARAANRQLRADMLARGNYFPTIEARAAQLTEAIGHSGGPLDASLLRSIVKRFDYTIVRSADLPYAARSLLDYRNRRLYLPASSRDGRDERIHVLRALADLALDHDRPATFATFLRQRVESNYFACALLMPESLALSYLRSAKLERRLDLHEFAHHFAVPYETAVHRFTNLATHHLSIPVHFSRVSRDGVIYKAYANDGVVFPTDVTGAIEGQLACRKWAVRQAFAQPDRFAPHAQYTDTSAGTFFCTAQVTTASAGEFSVGLGVPFTDSKWFRLRATPHRQSSTCPDRSCCRLSPQHLADRWEEHAFAQVRAHAHLLAAVPPGAFPGLDPVEIYEFLEGQAGLSD
ncbi:ImmA/IrrE family metallo-endopeptidase [Nanchangia anserum]|nr:ImmA/IrrE family metallo-endopeptidase [Nanchangia anserum]QOX81364.1 ImmA/IrrE family metallo-endopeptidase [Nanchangia anserum]